jgi:predicted nucleotidyltransferase
MYIDPKSQIAGVPALQVRKFLRRLDGYEWTGADIAASLDLPGSRAEKLVSELLQLGYIEPAMTRQGKPFYRRTLSGSAFSLASAARPLTRKTADKKLAEFLDRVRAVNVNPDLAYRVRKVLLFGSYLTGQERINDIDVAVELVFRETERSKREAALDARVQVALQAGRQFSNYTNQVLWPYEEVLLLLKSRSRAISLHPADDPILKQTESRVIFQDEYEGSTGD